MKRDPKAPQRAQILVVEGSSVFREMQGLLLAQAGYAVSSHESPLDALTAAASQRFDLVVIDYDLAEMPGERLMRELRKLQPELAVIFVARSLTLEVAIKLSRQGVAGFLNKPANPKALVAKINETLAGLGRVETSGGARAGMPPARRGNSESPFEPSTLTPAQPSPDRVAYSPRFFVGQSDAFRAFSHRAWQVRDFRTVLLLEGPTGSPFELFVRDLVRISIFREGPLMLCDAAHLDATTLIEVLAPALLSHDAGTLLVTGVESLTAAQQQTLRDLLGSRGVFLPFAQRVRVVLAMMRSSSEPANRSGFDRSILRDVGAVELTLPSLIEMRGDVAANAHCILDHLHESSGAESRFTFGPEVAAWLEQQPWPGNHDQLSRTLLAASRITHGNTLTVEAVSLGLQRPDAALFALHGV